MAGTIFVIMVLVDDKVEVESDDEGGGEGAGGGTDNKKRDKEEYGLKKIMMKNQTGVIRVIFFQKF